MPLKVHLPLFVLVTAGPNWFLRFHLFLQCQQATGTDSPFRYLIWIQRTHSWWFFWVTSKISKCSTQFHRISQEGTLSPKQLKAFCHTQLYTNSFNFLYNLLQNKKNSGKKNASSPHEATTTECIRITLLPYDKFLDAQALIVTVIFSNVLVHKSGTSIPNERQLIRGIVFNSLLQSPKSKLLKLNTTRGEEATGRRIVWSSHILAMLLNSQYVVPRIQTWRFGHLRGKI